MAKRKEKTTLSLKEELQEKSEQLHGSNSLFGVTLLTHPGYISGSRSMMFTSHFRQSRNLLYPEPPKVCTGYENIIGKYSTHNYTIDSEVEVAYKVPRFSGEKENDLYYLFIYDPKRDMYDMVEKKKVCNLTEFYGFRYNTDNMDSKHVGDTIKKGEILYASNSYDEDGNYRYGKNICTAYMIENYTIEDAIIVSESISEGLKSTDVNTVTISLNDNDIFANLYGDNEDYKCFPDIGETISNGIIASTKRIHNNQLLFDAKKQNLRKVNFATDTPYYTTGVVEDIFIYSNKPLEEVPNNRFYKQIREYLTMQEEFFTKMLEVCEEIINSGSKYTDDISYYYKRAKQYLDKKSKWVSDSNVAFNNMIIEFTVSQDGKLLEGHKLTGRCGNKGVVSKILPDDQMPFLENGKRVDIIVNALGVVNRMNSFQLFELEMNFISDRVIDRLKTDITREEKEDIVFTVLRTLNDIPEPTDALKAIYDGFNDEGKDKFFDSVIEHGLYYRLSPLWEVEGFPLFYRLSAIYDKYPWLKPADVYVNKFGRKIKILRPMIVGDLYYMKLRQSSKKGFSARSTGSISKLGVPEKSNKAKTHQDMNPRTPIRSGNMETVNLLVGVMPDVIAKLHKYYRTSVIGRRELGSRLMNSITELDSIETDEEVVNTNAEILNAYLKVLGIRIEFGDTDKDFVLYEDGEIEEWEYDDKVLIGTQSDFEEFIDRERALSNMREGKIEVLMEDEFDKRLKREMEYMRHEREGTDIEINL